MATLIKSKQIQGTVTASAVSGDFQVSGSFQHTGSLEVQGSITASSDIQATTFKGDGSLLSNVELSGRGIFSGSEQLPGGIISGSEQLPNGLISGSSQLTTEFDIRYGNELGDGLISGSVLRPGGDSVISSSAQIDYNSVQNTPENLISSSIQVLGSTGIISSSEQLPAGTLSSSAQVIYTDIPTRPAFIGGTNVTIGSGSGGITISAVLEGSAEASVTHLNTFTGSVFISSSEQITSLGFVSESAVAAAGTISGSKQITDLGFISASEPNTSLNTYTSSNDVRVNQLASATGSYITGLDSGIVSGAGQLGALGYISGSQVSSSIAYDGNRTISNTDLPSGVYNTNFGTSGSVMDFVEAVFFPNTSPTINSVSFSIDEYEDTNSIIGTVSATDAEGQTITFATQSGYTSDKFGIHPSTGVITARTRTTSSINTDTSLIAAGAHPFLIKATDTFNGSTNKTIHLRVTPNTSPKFREGSTGGNVITSVTSNLNENSPADTTVKRIYFTDAESDNITITTSSIDAHFKADIKATYVDIIQVTESLDYEVKQQYTFGVTASDEHFLSASQGVIGQTLIPITINVTDNVHPTLNNQTLSSISENSSNGASVGSISATDNEGDTITFSDFTLHKLELDNANVSSASYGGTSHSDPTNDAFQCSGTGAVTRKNGVHINSDLINEYQYTVRIRDSYNTASNEATITIPITDDTPPSISDNWSGGPYIIESAEDGDSLRVSTNGRSGTIAAFSANQTVTFSMNSGSGVFDVNSSNGRLTIKTDLSGSVTSSGDSVSGSVIATNTFGTTAEENFTASVAANQVPSIAFTDQSAKFETNLALNGVTMVSMSVSDDESDTPFSASLSGSDLQLVYSNANSSSIGLELTQNATAREYFYSVTITDQFGKSQTYSDRSFTVATSADYGRVFVYDVGFNNATYNTAVGITSEDGSTPPVPTPFTDIGFLDKIINDDTIGDSSFTYSYGSSQTATLLGEASGSNLHSVIRTMGSSGVMSRNSSKHFVILFPSGSDMGGIPTSTTDSYGGSTVGEYVLEVGTDGSTIDGSNTLEASEINQMTLGTSHLGYTKWFMVGATNQIASSTNFNLGLNPSSGSGGE